MLLDFIRGQMHIFMLTCFTAVTSDSDTLECRTKKEVSFRGLAVFLIGRYKKSLNGSNLPHKSS